MSAIIVDASVGVKWFLPEVHAAEAPLLAVAFDLAHRTERTVYDCLYLALAVQLGGRMLTADERLYRSVAATPFAPYVVWVANVEAAP